jgi:hypothetical protein
VHRRRCGCCRCIVRAAVPVLRSADRSCGAAAQDIAGDGPKYHASGDDRPDRISDIVSDIISGIVSDCVPHRVPDRFTVSLCDGDAVRACQSARRQALPDDVLKSEGVSLSVLTCRVVLVRRR